MIEYGATKYGFKRKPYIAIVEDMQTRARSYFGEDIDLSERSPLGLFIQTIAWEISLAWDKLETSYLHGFALHAEGVALDWVASNLGKFRHPAQKAKGYVVFAGDDETKIPQGFLLGTKSEVLFETVEEVTITEGTASVNILAREAGSKGNVAVGAITEIINPIAGVSAVSNPNPTTGGQDAESDEYFRSRYLDEVREPATGDNVVQYKIWARDVPGVGAVKVKPTTPTKGYVTIVITDANGMTAPEDLVNAVYEYIDKVRPVNAGIIVRSATAKTIRITASVKLAPGYTIQQVQSEFEEHLEQYRREIALDNSYISHAAIGNILFSTTGVIDHADLQLNGSVQNIVLADEEMPVFDAVELAVM